MDDERIRERAKVEFSKWIKERPNGWNNLDMNEFWYYFVAAERDAAIEQCAQNWLVWSCEHELWWRANRCGYTAYIAEAGRYSLADALECCKGRSPRTDGKPNEIPVPSPEWLELYSAAIRSRGAAQGEE